MRKIGEIGEHCSLMKNSSHKKQIFEVAWKIVEEQGIGQLSVRKIASLSNCSLGSIYNAFQNFQELKLQINIRILEKLYKILNHVIMQGFEKNKSLREVMLDLGLQYIAFAKENPLLWKALFENSASYPLPEWYIVASQQGVYELCEHLATIYKIPVEKTKQMIGFYWASTHGICAIILNQKVDITGELFNENYLNLFLDACVEGLFKQLENKEK